MSLAYRVFIFCQKSVLSNRFSTLYTHLQPFYEMVFSGKSHCCNDTFAIYIASGIEYLIRRKIILDV